MDKFVSLTGVAAPLPMINVDTDMIIPKQFLKTIKRTGLGSHLCSTKCASTTTAARSPTSSSTASPTVSSASPDMPTRTSAAAPRREHAPWALLDFGIRCVIAPSFADIFFNNCVNNGILAITLPHAEVHALLKDADGGHNARFTVDLESQTITRPDGSTLTFEIEPERKHRLLNGLDPIGLSLQKDDAISGFEARVNEERPWL